MVESRVSNTIITKEKKHKAGITNWYDAFCKEQEKQGILWFLIPLMSMPTVIMPLSIMAMSYFPGYIAFIGISIVLFFTNIVLTVAEQSIKTKINFFLITIAYHLFIPLFAFLFGLYLG